MIRDLIGIPWKMHGRTIEGADCIGLALLAQAELGRDVLDPWLDIRAAIGDVVATKGTVESLDGWVRTGSPGLHDIQTGDVLEHTVEGDDGHTHLMVAAEDGYVLTTGPATSSYIVPLVRVLPVVELRALWRAE